MSMIAASNPPLSTSSRAAAMVGAGPTTAQPISPMISAVNGATTGESSTMRTRLPSSPAVIGAGLRDLVDEPGCDIAVGTRHFHLGSRIQHQETFAVGMRLNLADEVQVDDGRAMDALKAA